MAFNAISSTAIQVGKAIKKSLLTKIKDNFDDHETRINSLEAGASKVEIFNFELIGFIDNYTVSELAQIGTFKAAVDLTITEIKITLMNGVSASSSSSGGSLSIDIKKSSDSGATWSSILSSFPEIADGTTATGSESGSITFISGGEDVLVDDMLRVDVTSLKDTQGTFLITVYGEIS